MAAEGDKMSEKQPIIQARGLMKRYGTVIAMDGADFDLYPGEICAVIGDNWRGQIDLDQGSLWSGCTRSWRGLGGWASGEFQIPG